MSTTGRRSFAPGEARSELGKVLGFMRLIWQVDHALQRTSKRMESTLGVTAPQRFVIRIVARFPGIPAGQLAKLLHLHPSTLTGIVQRLDQRGLLRRRVDPRDARRTLLVLTGKGRAFNVQAEGTVEACVEQVLNRTAHRKIAAAREVLVDVAGLLGRSVADVSAATGARIQTRQRRGARRR